ncbi:LysR family transcriptional regulator, hydrogen peroxide-inducible genes activator [Filimonas lacunae]|uniref:LysR family transcriptional regulator, hydrogen peroxide-inducible genes activator n=1 Tax=Filimonas lacunae TaxID=477680 RepID=A0A173MMW5_9BACT|nr:hydrogen peroxide-inducible genes activator [Filimonas lacunae]BAV08826.1 hydrogen peroxide-inducible genes activator [Filimonas lacunae]SIS62363.1 LysR family transcriptional regulator, hydrogen peroxide-inducible genes activator [Filimonas lacunae]
MTFTQLEYIVAVDMYRHFADAAQHCFVTQPTLSMQIHKLEEELGVKIFDRSKQPVLPTEAGIEIIEQSRRILSERNALTEMIDSRKGIVNGELKVGIIPTLAPYLLPLFVTSFTKKYPQVRLVVNELTTSNIVTRLKEGKIDAGILVTPLQEQGIKEDVLFYEELMAYVSKNNEAYKKSYVLAKDIDPDKLWLLEEGHCFRSQIINLCELRRSGKTAHFEYEAGSLETLRRMVDLNDGITILPELASLDMMGQQLKMIRHFKHPAPVREVSIVTHRDFVKRKLVEVLKQTILLSIPDKLRKNKKQQVVPVLDHLHA